MRISGLMLAALGAGAAGVEAMSTARRVELREQVRSMFHHGYTGYMEHAYPADELRPVTCAPLWRDPDATNIGVNDIHANVSMTLVDSLSALLLVLPDEWPAAVERVATTVSFDQDVKVQVFEMTIRALGALLSTYQRLTQLPDAPTEQAASLGLQAPEVNVKQHAPAILALATDLARRLRPAFTTTTGIPYARVNLRSGVERGESTETCAAGAGTLLLEFASLSRFTRDPSWEMLAHRAFMAVWNRRTEEDLVGNQIEVTQGRWLPPGVSGIHAGIDSFFEYALKAAILLDDSAYMDIFYDAYAALQTHVRTEDGFIYRPVYLLGLKPTAPSYVDSLSAFFPGVMVLAGDIESAIRAHLVYWNIWRKFNAIPESWDTATGGIGWGGYPGRPEFVESTYYLYRATGDDFYLRVGERVLNDIVRRTITPCGFATLSNVETGETADRMESFLLSETLKYLYLLFDPSPSRQLSNTVFTTEAHPLSLPRNPARIPPSAAWRASHRREDLYCPVYVPPSINGIIVGIEGREDYDYARSLVLGATAAALAAETDLDAWGYGICARKPTTPRHTIELVLIPADTPPDDPLPPHDKSPGPAKVFQTEDGDWVIANVDGLHVGTRWRLDGLGYDVVSIGPYRVRPGQFVTIRDVKMHGYLPAVAPSAVPSTRPDRARLLFRAPARDTVLGHSDAVTAVFGLPLTRSSPGPALPGSRWHVGSPLQIFSPPAESDTTGCGALDRALFPPVPGFVLLVDRGVCSFTDKARRAAEAGAVGLVIADYPLSSKPSDEAGLVRPAPSSESDDDDEADHGDLDLVVVLMPHSSAVAVRSIMNGTVVTVEPELYEEDDILDATGYEGPVGAAAAAADPTAILDDLPREGRLVVNDHEIINMRVVELCKQPFY